MPKNQSEFYPFIHQGCSDYYNIVTTFNQVRLRKVILLQRTVTIFILFKEKMYLFLVLSRLFSLALIYMCTLSSKNDRVRDSNIDLKH